MAKENPKEMWRGKEADYERELRNQDTIIDATLKFN